MPHTPNSGHGCRREVAGHVAAMLLPHMLGWAAMAAVAGQVEGEGQAEAPVGVAGEVVVEAMRNGMIGRVW